MDPEEYRDYVGQQDRIDALFDVLAKGRLAEWIALAEERLAGSHVRVFLCGGNDDTDEVLSALDEVMQDRVVSAENRSVAVDDEHVVVTIGYSTPTPWETPREKSDPEIAEVIEKVMAGVADPSRAVFNFHCPPLNSTLDTCLSSTPPSGHRGRSWRTDSRCTTAPARRRWRTRCSPTNPPWASTGTSTSRGG